MNRTLMELSRFHASTAVVLAMELTALIFKLLSWCSFSHHHEHRMPDEDNMKPARSTRNQEMC